MSRATWLAATLAAIAAGGAGYWSGRSSGPLPAVFERARTELASWAPAASVAEPAAPTSTGPIVYYRSPDGLPAYSLEPKSTRDGRAYRPVRASEDLGFEGDRATAMATPTAPGETKRVRFYRNPMGLPDTSPSPKKDSMGMDYIPVYEGEAEDGNVVRVSPGKLQRTGVRSEPAALRIVSRPVRVPGTIQPDERRITVVSTRSDAFVEKVENVTTGDFVRKGQPLVRVFSPEINSAAAQLVVSPGLEGSRRRLSNLNVPAEAIAEMERTRNVPSAITWSSPRDGVVLERGAVEGMKAPAGMVLFRIVDISVMWLMADVPEYELGSVKVGQTATARVRSLAGRTFTGRVEVIYPQLNKENRTARVRIQLPNPDGALLADMYADVEITTGAGAPVVSVPDDAVIDTGARQVVLLDKGEGRFEPREVRTGARGTGYVEIREGITEGDRVVVAANFLIDAESNLKAALQTLSAAPAASGPQAVAGEMSR